MAAIELVYASCGPILVDGLMGVMIDYVQTGDADKKVACATATLGLVLTSNNTKIYLKFGADSVEIGTETPHHLSLSLSYSGGVYSLLMSESRGAPLESQATAGIMKEARKKGLDFKLLEG